MIETTFVIKLTLEDGATPPSDWDWAALLDLNDIENVEVMEINAREVPDGE